MTKALSTVATTKTTTALATGLCIGNGYVRDPNDCRVFYLCTEVEMIRFECSPGLYFDPSINACNFEAQVVQVAATRAAFVQNVVNYVLSKGFDGFDLVWVFPTMRGGIPADKVYLVNAWLDKGADPSKIIMDVGFDGQSFILEDPNNHDPGACSSGPGPAGPYTQYPGYIAYNEVVFSAAEQAEYMYQGVNWVTYESEKALKLKAAFAKTKALAGISCSDLEFDDYDGTCGSKYPLLNAVRSVLFPSP